LIIFLFYNFLFGNISVDNLKAQLPWQSGTAVSVTVYVQGTSDFILPAITDSLSNLPSGDDFNSLPSISGIFRLI
jgi:hypothetical protein